jgi:anthranilate phosphoribosyltransferase
MNIQEATEKLETGEDLTRAEARALMGELLSGKVPDTEIVHFLAALRDKGERPQELVGFAEVMRAHAMELLRQSGVAVEEISRACPLLDTCGTGGDGQGTFNVSTATAVVAAAAGVHVAKHGNRSISSRCGSADVLEALGVALDLPFEHLTKCLEQVGMVFLFAPHLHPAMQKVMKARRSLGTKSVFNWLGPLSNPLGASVQLVGVYDLGRTETMARALAQIGTRRSFVVAAHDGLDEVSTTGATQLSETANGEVRTRQVFPEDFGVRRAPPGAFRGGDAAMNAGLMSRILDGDKSPYRDVVLANASAALVVAGKAKEFKEGVGLAAQAIDSGAARRTLAKLVEFTQQYCR